MDSLPNEIWKVIPGCEDRYEVSNQGRVKSLGIYFNPRWNKIAHAKPMILKATLHRGYLVVGIRRDKKRVFGIHQLVMQAFVGERPFDKVVNHIDGNKQNNNLENLEYITNSENVFHAHRTGLLNAKGASNANSKLSFSQVIEIRESNDNRIELSKRYGVSTTHIGRIRKLQIRVAS